MNARTVLPFLAIDLSALYTVAFCLVFAGPVAIGKSGKDVLARWKADLTAAHVAQCAGDFRRAEHLWLTTLKEAESLPANDAALAETLYEMSRFYSRSGAFDQAVPVLRRFISTKERNPEKTYFYLTWHQCELADLFFDQHQWRDAITAYEAAVRVWDDTRRWPALIPALDRLGYSYFKLDDPVNAEKCYKQALDVWKKARPMRGLERHKYIMDGFAAQTLAHYSLLLANTGHDSQAMQLSKQADQIWTSLDSELARIGAKSSARSPAVVLSTNKTIMSHLSAGYVRPVTILERLAFHYCRLGKYAEAETLYDSIMRILTTSGVAGKSDNSSIRREAIVAICRSQQACEKLGPPPYSVAETAKTGASLNNTYLDDFNRIKTREDFYKRRSALVSKYAYAVPTREALYVFRKYQPILEIGAGTGYWDYLLRRIGLKVVAYELYPLSSGKNAWFPQASKSWTEVLPGDETVVTKYPHHTLFMCYPPGRTPVAYNAVKSFKGNRLLYVGESAGLAPGQGQDDFQALLANEWRLVKQIELPQWPGLYDALFVYERKSP